MAQTDQATVRREFLSESQMKWVVATLLLYFGIRLVYFATNIAPFLPPDEVTHLQVSRVFSKVLLLPSNSPETYEHGLVTNIPWLYYWIMGKLLCLNFFGTPDLMFLRLCNVPLAFGSVCFLWRTMGLLTGDRVTRVLLLVAITNTLKFSFLSAAVSYDNLVNLLAVMAIYYLLAFFKERSGDSLALSLACQLAGCLAKSSFLPLFLILNLVLLVHEAGNLRFLPRAFPEWLKGSGWRGKTVLLVAGLGLAFNLQLYGGNLLRYGHLEPEMQKVVGFEAAMQNRIQARNMIFNLFKEGRVSKEKALEMSVRVPPSDRADIITWIQTWDDFRSGKGQKLMAPWEYGMWWFFNMISTVYGIKAYRYMPDNGPMMYVFAGLLLCSLVAFLARWRPGRDNAAITASLAVTACFYVFFILRFVNYSTYLDTRVFGVTLTGRYLLPVIGAIYVVSGYYLMGLFRNGYARAAFAVAVAVLFLASDFPFFMYHATPEWFVAG